ncbi:MAG: tetratricopeptide repeat protein [Arenimonas sp.]|uniref:tetratricopeptide repeat protein n=1 Tax=Arenimonas sp. TaxID=1872635 RepID=UPI0025C19BAD|nr:tetratricopeptide repeat protein [Arenimonas sp.]MBW8367194.1 tetratricopeptide repeat protein [Arenimonas sp.]
MNWHHRLILPVLLLAPLGSVAAVPPPIGDVMAGEFALQQGDVKAAARYYLLAARTSTDPGIAGRATRIALLGDQPGLAGRALERWRALAPDEPAMRASAIRLALGQGEHETAMDDAKALLALPDAAGFPVLLVALAEATGDDAVIARSVLRELFAQSLLPHELGAWLRAAGLAKRLDDAAFSDRIVAAGLAAFPDDPRVRLLLASRQREAGDLAGARAALVALRDSGDISPDLRRSAAGELALVGEPRMAAKLLAEGPQDDASFGQRASWLLGTQDRAAMRALYDEIRSDSAAPGSSRRLLLGHVAEALSLWDEAGHWYAGVTTGEGRDLAMLRSARVQALQGRLEPALETLHELQADTSADGERVRDAYLIEAELLGGGGRSDDALAAIERGLAIFEADPVLLYARAMAHERADRVDAALADLRRIIDDNPADAHALNAYGYTLADRRREYATALPFVRRAHALEPQSAPILDSLGWIELRLGRKEAALALLRKAWSLQKDAEIAAHLGEALWLAGLEDDARAVWREGQGIDPRNRALLNALENFTP